MRIEPIPLAPFSCFGRSKRARMFPTEIFRICVRPVPSDTRMSAENSTFCADVATVAIKSSNINAIRREKAFMSAPVRLEVELLARPALLLLQPRSCRQPIPAGELELQLFRFLLTRSPRIPTIGLAQGEHN